MSVNPTVLNGANLSPAELSHIADGKKLELDPAALITMKAARSVVDAAVASNKPVYGVTTGLGPKVLNEMPASSMDSFSVNTIRGRAHAVGAPLDRRWVRAGMAVRANTLLIGAAGARPELAQLLVACLNANVTPLVAESGSIGVADLPWGAALGLSLIGEGQMIMPDDSVLPSSTAMESLGLTPFKPQPREGLALVSHSSITAGIAGLGWGELKRCYESLQSAAALSLEGFRANLSPLDSRVLALRPQAGQLEAAEGLRLRLNGSVLFNEGEARRLQDPLSLRNVAQVHGAVYAMLENARLALDSELNGASDNPAVLVDSAEILSNGGYLPAHLCLSLNAMNQSMVHLAALQVSRIAKLLFHRFSGLPNGLTAVGAEGAGFSPVMKTVETLFAEIAHLAAPSAVYPGLSADGLEDVVTHTAIPTKAIFPIAQRLRQLTAIEALVAVQAIDLRSACEGMSPVLQNMHQQVREVSALLAQDRPLGREIDELAELLRSGLFEI